MTCPEIGNYGVTDEDVESRGTAGRRVHRPQRIADGEQLARRGHRCATTSRDNGIVAISDIDTRALTRLLRSSGVMRGVIATGRANPDDLVDRARAIAADGRRRPRQGRHVRPRRSTGLAGAAGGATTSSRCRLPREASRPLQVAAYDSA